MEGTNSNNGIMNGKRGDHYGVANDRSIAWGIAACSKAGEQSLLLHIKEMLSKKEVRPLLSQLALI